MERIDTSSVIDLPVSLILTDDGLFFFSKHRSAPHQSDKGGMCLESFSASTLQRMILAGYISSVEVSRSDFTSKRQELMDVSKLIMYGTLYRHFPDALWKSIATSDLILRYNRSHPKTPFTREHLDRGGAIDASGKGTAAPALALLEELALSAADEVLRERPSCSEQEKDMMRAIGRRYLSHITAPFWLLLASSQEAVADPMLDTLRTLVVSYIGKASIADYLALLLMELGVYAEKKLVGRATKELFHGNLDADAVMRNDEARSRVLAEMERMGFRVTVVWKIMGRTASIGTDNRLEVILYDRGSDSETLKNQIETKKGMDTKNHSLLDYYEKIVSSASGEELGLFYLGYIEEACQKQDIRFDSHVSRIEKNDLTIIRLAFHFR